MNILSPQKRVILFYSSFVLWVGINMGLFFYLLFNFWVLIGEVSHLLVIPYIPLVGALYFSLDLIKKRKLLFFIFLLAFFAADALALFGIVREMLGLVVRNDVPGLVFAYLFVGQSILQLILIIGFFIYERVAKNAKHLRKIAVPFAITVGVYLLYRLVFWIWFITGFKV